jgi:hypothetical protein
MKNCTAKMNSPYIPIRYEGYSGDHVYYKEGLSLRYDGEKLTSIGIFPFSPNFKKWLADNSATILQAYEDSE